MKRLCVAVMAMMMMLSCGEKKVETTLSGLDKANFVSEVDGKSTALYVLRNKIGLEATITNYGGRVVSLLVPDKNGKMTDVILGYDNIETYLAETYFHGALIGRYGNRIANGKFSLDGVEYTLPQNDGKNSLHGGGKGFYAKVWDAKQIDGQTLELTYLSVDGEEGYPGNLNVKVTYTLTDDNALDIAYEATTDKKTVVNLTNHSYFNLSGAPSQPITNHLITINADSYTEVDDVLIPTGALPSVENTPMDLRNPIAIGERIDEKFDQLVKGGGYDHNWVLNTNGSIATLAARVVSPTNGIVLEVYTTEPGIQFYAGNFMTEDNKLKHGLVSNYRCGFCLETQHFPDSPNQPSFPSTELNPGETYKSRCVYKLTTEE